MSRNHMTAYRKHNYCVITKITIEKRRNDERMIFLYYGLFVFSFEGYGVVLSFHCLLSSLALASLGLREPAITLCRTRG